MHQVNSSSAVIVATLAMLTLGGCGDKTAMAEKEPTPPTSSQSIPDWNASIRMVETGRDVWSVAVAGGRGVALCPGSAPKAHSTTNFGSVVSLSPWNVSVRMVRAQDDQWYVVVAGGTDVSICPATGKYVDGAPTYTSEITDLTGWNSSVREVVLQDGNHYVVIAGGTGVDVRPIDSDAIRLTIPAN